MFPQYESGNERTSADWGEARERMPANANNDYDQARDKVETVRTNNEAPGLTWPTLIQK